MNKGRAVAVAKFKAYSTEQGELNSGIFFMRGKNELC
jgi:hypothetical protein